MTNKEALKRMKWTKGRTGITSEEAEAIGYAIEKLSNSDKDCISRAKALAEIEVLKKIHFDRVVVLNKVSDSISALPSIQPKPKTDVLDKIRVQIKEESRFCPFTEGLERALEIIDKYKAESEDKE